MDGDVRKEAAKIFKKQGMAMMLGHKVTGAQVDGKKSHPHHRKNLLAGTNRPSKPATCWCRIGRRPNTDGLALDKAG